MFIRTKIEKTNKPVTKNSRCPLHNKIENKIYRQNLELGEKEGFLLNFQIKTIIDFNNRVLYSVTFMKTYFTVIVLEKNYST